EFVFFPSEIETIPRKASVIDGEHDEHSIEWKEQNTIFPAEHQPLSPLPEGDSTENHYFANVKLFSTQLSYQKVHIHHYGSMGRLTIFINPDKSYHFLIDSINQL